MHISYHDRKLSSGAAVCAIIVTLSLLIAACGQSVPTTPLVEAPLQTTTPPTVLQPTISPIPSATSTLAATPTSSQTDLLLDAAKAEGTLNVIALPHNWMNYGEVISTFSQKYGIAVNEINPGAASLDELKAIRNSGVLNDQNAPDVIDVGLSFAVQAKSEKLLQPYKVSTWDTIPEGAKDSEGYWYGDYYGVMAFEINPQFVPSIPEDWPDLLKPQFKVALAGSPTSSYIGMMAVYSASFANGETLKDITPGFQFFQKLNDLGNFVHGNGNIDTTISGQTPIILRWDYLALNDRYANAGKTEIVVVIPKTGIVAGLYTQAISKYAPHPNAAKLWMEFLYSDEGQLLWLKGLGHPIRFSDLKSRGVIPKDLLDRLPPSEPYLNAVFPTSEEIDAADEAILAGWDSYFR